MGTAPPAFQFYHGDFIGGTGRMTTTQVGGYLLLLCEQWTQGSVPGDEPKALAAIMRCTIATAREIWVVVGKKFKKGPDGFWRNVRLEQVRREQQEYRAAKSRGGKAGADARWHNHDKRMTDRVTDKVAEPSQNVSQNDGSSVSGLQEIDQNKERSDLAKPHPVKDLLGYHERQFFDRYGERPAKYTGKDAKHAKDLLDSHGGEKSKRLIDALFASHDSFIAKSGHSMGVLMSVQNKLIAELSGRAHVADGLDGLREFTRG